MLCVTQKDLTNREKLDFVQLGIKRYSNFKYHRLNSAKRTAKIVKENKNG